MAKIIGLDIGGSKICGVLFDGKKVIKELTIKTPKHLLEFERNLLKLADFLSAGSNIYGIGVGIAGLMDTDKGVAKHSPNIKFIRNFPLTDLFKSNGYKNVRIENDARCFALAETAKGQGKGKNNVACITLGTGIGGGVVCNGKLLHGANYASGEVGHMIYEGKNTFEHLFQKARDKKDKVGLVNIVGSLLTNVYRVLDPDIVILGGGVALYGSSNFLSAVKKKCAKNLGLYKIVPQIKISKLKNAGAIGAALLFN